MLWQASFGKHFWPHRLPLGGAIESIFWPVLPRAPCETSEMLGISPGLLFLPSWYPKLVKMSSLVHVFWSNSAPTCRFHPPPRQDPFLLMLRAAARFIQKLLQMGGLPLRFYGLVSEFEISGVRLFSVRLRGDGRWAGSMRRAADRQAEVAWRKRASGSWADERTQAGRCEPADKGRHNLADAAGPTRPGRHGAEAAGLT